MSKDKPKDPPGTVPFSIGIIGPVGLLDLECKPTSKRMLKDMLFAAVDQYYDTAAERGYSMHAGAPVIEIATAMPEPSKN